MEDLEQLECYVYPGRIAVASGIERKIEERTIWNKRADWSCVLVGGLKLDGNEIVPVVEDFFELPTYSLNREHFIVNLNDILRIAEKFYFLGLYLSHSSGDVMPSPSDIAIFLYADILIGRPMLYIIAGPKGKLILSFSKCHSCSGSLFKLIHEMRKRR